MKKLIAAFFIGIFLIFPLFQIVPSIYADTIEYENIPITTDGTIFVVNKEADRLYIGGNFSKVQIGIGEPVARTNIAAILLSNRTIEAWNPELPFEVRSLEFIDASVFVKNYIESEKDTIPDKREVSINKETGEVQEAEIITPNPKITSTPTPTFIITPIPQGEVKGLMIDQSELGFRIPTLSDILTFAIRGFFGIAGLTALFYLLLGAFSWITSGGDKDTVQAARDKMQAAVVGVLMMVGVLAIAWTLEQVVFKSAICFGISCPVTLPTLITPTT